MKTLDRPIRRKRAVLIAGAFVTAILVAVALDRVIEFTSRPSVVSNTVQTGTASPPSFAFSFFDQPRAVPEIRFVDREGRALTLADFRAQPVILNIWATWCVPCRKEMPSLDRMQAEFGAAQLTVLPLSIDRQGLPAVKKFYDELGLSSLGMYLDQSGAAASELNAVGVPVTLLIDREGREIGRKVGPAEWDSPEIVALIREHFGLAMNGQQARP